MSKGIDQYKFGRKNNWRRQVWNEIKRRVKDRKNARILYLAGPQNADVTVAVSKGFDAANMIAVEADEVRAKALRSMGVNCVPADLNDVCFSWPSKHKVDVVVADFCQGLVGSTASIMNAMQRYPFQDAKLLVNMQRGRDAWSNPIRKSMQNIPHRGKQWWMLQVISFAPIDIQNKGGEDSAAAKKARMEMEDIFRPWYATYKGNRVYMDSVLVSMPWHLSSNEDKKKRHIAQLGWENQEIKKKCIAAVAVQTRVKNNRKSNGAAA